MSRDGNKGEKHEKVQNHQRCAGINFYCMDVQMPKMNGLDATRAIRGSDNPLGKTIPIIAMTANAFSSDIQDCINAGMDAHVAKPLEMSVLEKALRESITPLPAKGHK